MSEKTNDGGPAFPFVVPEIRDGEIGIRQGYSDSGMTLRDYFAAAALQGLSLHYAGYCGDTKRKVAKEAYDCADAMLLERNKTK